MTPKLPPIPKLSGWPRGWHESNGKFYCTHDGCHAAPEIEAGRPIWLVGRGGQAACQRHAPPEALATLHPREVVEDFLCEYVPARIRDEARQMLGAMINRFEMEARVAEAETQVAAATAREEASGT